MGTGPVCTRACACKIRLCVHWKLSLGKLMHISHLHNRLDFEQGLFHNLATLWLSEMGQLAFSGHVPANSWAEWFEMRHILNIFRTDSILVTACSFSSFWGYIWLSEINQIWAFVVFSGERMVVNAEQRGAAYFWRFTSGFCLVAKWYEEFCGIQLLVPDFDDQIDGLVQDCSIFLANALEKQQSCTKPSIYSMSHIFVTIYVIQCTCGIFLDTLKHGQLVVAMNIIPALCHQLMGSTVFVVLT